MNLPDHIHQVLRILALLVYAAFSALFLLVQSYQPAASGVFTALPYAFWTGFMAILAYGSLLDNFIQPSRVLQILLSVAALWVWAVLFTATLTSYGLNILLLPYTLAILLDAVLLASNFHAKR